MTFGHKLSGKKAKQLIDRGGVAVDVRNAVSFRDGSLPGSVNMSLRQLALVGRHNTRTPIILVGDATDPTTLAAAVNYITMHGFTTVYSFEYTDDWDK